MVYNVGYNSVLESDNVYSVKQLCEICHITQQSFYRILKSNSEFSQLAESHRQSVKGAYAYDDVVLAWMVEHYNVKTEPQADEAATPSDDTSKEQSSSDTTQDYATLKALYERVLAENDYLKQLVQQEKQEKDKMLVLLAREQETKLLAEPKQEPEQAEPPAPSEDDSDDEPRAHGWLWRVFHRKAE